MAPPNPLQSDDTGLESGVISTVTAGLLHFFKHGISEKFTRESPFRDDSPGGPMNLKDPLPA